MKGKETLMNKLEKFELEIWRLIASQSPETEGIYYLTKIAEELAGQEEADESWVSELVKLIKNFLGER